MYTITPYNPGLFHPEIGLCREGRNGPSRHATEFVVSNPAFTKPLGFCWQHLDAVAVGESELSAVWEETKKTF